MELPKGVNLSVPDLSLLKPQPPFEKLNPASTVVVRHGDKVIVLLPQMATAMEVDQVSRLLKQWAPQTEFLVLSGPESITVIPGDPGGAGWNKEGINPAPVEDKAPQGLNEWSDHLKTHFGTCEYCQRGMISLRVEPFGQKLACKGCFDTLTGDE